MSDMNTPEVPAQEPAAAPAVQTEVARPVEEPTPLGAISEPATVVRQESSNEDVKPEKEEKRERMSGKDATRVLVDLVRAHRSAGDAAVEEAIGDIEYALGDAPEDYVSPVNRSVLTDAERENAQQAIADTPADADADADAEATTETPEAPAAA